MDDFSRFRYFQQSSYASCCGRPAATTAIPKKLLFQPFFSAPLQNSLISTDDGGRRKKRLCNVKWSPSGEVPTNPKCVHSLASQSTGEIVVNRTYRVTRPPWIIYDFWAFSLLFTKIHKNPSCDECVCRNLGDRRCWLDFTLLFFSRFCYAVAYEVYSPNERVLCLILKWEKQFSSFVISFEI